MIRTETIDYRYRSRNYQGKISWDDTITTTKPGILVAHAFGGQSKFDEEKTIELAKLGYVGFAIDMYGKGRRASSSDEAKLLMDELNNNRSLLLERIQNSVKTLKTHPEVDKNRIAGIGFCFGGKCVLDLARSGADVRGVVSFHGVYDKPNMHHNKSIKAAVLILHGWEDPLNTPGQTIDLAKELTEKKADWQILSMGNTGHAFTNPKAKFPENGMVYNAKANRRAWNAMNLFLKEIME